MNLMSMLGLYFISITFFLQGGEGRFLEEQVNLYSSSAIQPLQQVIQKLNRNLAELVIKKKELELHKIQLIEKLNQIPIKCHNEDLQQPYSIFTKWDLDSCVNLTDDWKVGADLALKGVIIFLNVTKVLGDIGNNILNCPNQPVLKVLPCYNTNLTNLRKAIDSIRGETSPFIDNALKTANVMKKDFDYCVGIPYQVKEKLEKKIENIRC